METILTICAGKPHASSMTCRCHTDLELTTVWASITTFISSLRVFIDDFYFQFDNFFSQFHRHQYSTPCHRRPKPHNSAQSSSASKPSRIETTDATRHVNFNTENYLFSDNTIFWETSNCSKKYPLLSIQHVALENRGYFFVKAGAFSL